MKLKNKTRNTLLAELVESLEGLGAVRGLIGADRPKAIFFKTRFGIHTFGVPFSIDVLILDKDDTVVKKKENLRPQRVFLWSPKFDKVVELPQGTIEKTGTKLEDTLEFSN